MDRECMPQIRAKAARLYEQGRNLLLRLPAKARVVLGFFLVAAVLMALHSALSGKDASLHLTVQHGFRNANFSLWIDDDLAYSGALQGEMKRKFGLIPASVQGSLSEILPVSAGNHQIRVRIESENGSTQRDSLTGTFAHGTERELSVSARPSELSLAWRATNASTTPGSGWLARYAGALFLTIGGSIISALTGFALKELPAHIGTRDAEPKSPSTAVGQ
jgi:hypothetical protein